MTETAPALRLTDQQRELFRYCGAPEGATVTEDGLVVADKDAFDRWADNQKQEMRAIEWRIGPSNRERSIRRRTALTLLRKRVRAA